MTNIMDSTSGRQTVPFLFHIIVTEDSITTLLNQGGSSNPLDQNYKIYHFGPYLVRSGVQMHASAPYTYFANAGGTTIPWGAFWSTILGSTTGPQAINEGSVVHPTLMQSGAQTMGLVIYSSINGLINTNNNLPDGYSNYEKFPVYVAYANSTTAQYGILGQLKHLYYGWGMPCQTVSIISASAAFGTATPTADKMIVPWSGSYPGLLRNSRTGRNISFNTD
jgi:hypothetical protein